MEFLSMATSYLIAFLVGGVTGMLSKDKIIEAYNSLADRVLKKMKIKTWVALVFAILMGASPAHAVSLSWSPVTTDTSGGSITVNQYRVYTCGVYVANCTNKTLFATVNPPSTQTTITGQTVGMVFVVTAFSTLAGESANSGLFTTDVPAAVTNVRFSGTNVLWNAVTMLSQGTPFSGGMELTEYRIFSCGMAATTCGTRTQIGIVNPPTVQFSVSSQPVGMSYMVTAFNRIGQSSDSNVLRQIAPSVPTGLRVD